MGASFQILALTAGEMVGREIVRATEMSGRNSSRENALHSMLNISETVYEIDIVDLYMTLLTVVISNDLEELSEIFNHTRHRAPPCNS